MERRRRPKRRGKARRKPGGATGAEATATPAAAAAAAAEPREPKRRRPRRRPTKNPRENGPEEPEEAEKGKDIERRAKPPGQKKKLRDASNKNGSPRGPPGWSFQGVRRVTDNRCKIEGSEQYKLELAGRTISIANNQDRGFVFASEIPNLEIGKT